MPINNNNKYYGGGGGGVGSFYYQPFNNISNIRETEQEDDQSIDYAWFIGWLYIVCLD